MPLYKELPTSKSLSKLFDGLSLTLEVDTIENDATIYNWKVIYDNVFIKLIAGPV